MKIPFKKILEKRAAERRSTELYRKAAREIVERKRVVALTGAGISVDSGIPDFRSSCGLWDRFDPMEYAHIDSFHRNPDKVWELIRELAGMMSRAKPNPGHLGLGLLEALGFLQSVITQNVDGLHQEAGNKDVIEYHGNSRHLVCLQCNERYASEEAAGCGSSSLPRCKCNAVLKPDMIFFGEPIPVEAQCKAQAAAKQCSVMLVVGTSAVVYPAAQIPLIAKSGGALIIEVNLEETHLTGTITDIFLQGSASNVFPQLVEAVQAHG